MGTIISAPQHAFAQEAAVKLAASLNADDEDGWTYKVVNNPKKDGPRTAIIEVYAEDGSYVGLM